MHPDVEHVSLKDFKQLAENRLDTQRECNQQRISATSRDCLCVSVGSSWLSSKSRVILTVTTISQYYAFGGGSERRVTLREHLVHVPLICHRVETESAVCKAALDEHEFTFLHSRSVEWLGRCSEPSELSQSDNTIISSDLLPSSDYELFSLSRPRSY